MPYTKIKTTVKPVIEFVKINSARKEASMFVYVASFMDNGHHIAYIPSLELSAYGESPEEATKMLFEEVVTDMVHNLFSLSPSDVSKEMKKYGWHKAAGIPNKKFYNDRPSISPSGILENFNLPQDTTIEVKMMEAEAA